MSSTTQQLNPQTVQLLHTLIANLICCCLMTSSVTGTFEYANPVRSVQYKQPGYFYDMNEKKLPSSRSARSKLEMAIDGQDDNFAYPLTSRSAAMISGRGFRPGKRSGWGTLLSM